MAGGRHAGENAIRLRSVTAFIYAAINARYLSQPFNASFWSFSFGVSALATTGLHLGHGSESGLFHILAVPLFIFTNAIIALLLVRTFLLLVQGTLLIRTERAALLKTEEK